MLILGNYYKDDLIVRIIIYDKSYQTSPYETVLEYKMEVVQSNGDKISYTNRKREEFDKIVKEFSERMDLRDNIRLDRAGL